MKAKFINESDNRLKIYKNLDGTYDAIRDSILYHFMWSTRTYRVYNFKKVGPISDKYTFNGELIPYPHKQMLFQVQRKINISNI